MSIDLGLYCPVPASEAQLFFDLPSAASGTGFAEGLVEEEILGATFKVSTLNPQ